MSTPKRSSKPASRRQQAVDYYLRSFMRYVVGGGGLIWEVLIDKLHNSLAIIVFGALATSTDMVTLIKDLVVQAKTEKEAFEMAQRELEDMETDGTMDTDRDDDGTPRRPSGDEDIQ